MRGALILEEHFILHVSWKLRHSSFHHLPSVVLPGCHKPGSCCVKPSHFENFSWSFRVEKIENQWNPFLAEKISLVEPSSGTRKYVKNRPIFGKCRVLRIKIKSLVSARFPWSFTLNLSGCARLVRILHESCGAFVWKRAPRKSCGALMVKCAAAWGGKRFIDSWWIKLQILVELGFNIDFYRKPLELKP